MAKEKVIETSIRELCNKIASRAGHLLVNDEDAVVVYQDLIGHATVEENRALANDPALMETFYRIYGEAYGTVAAIKFYMANSDKVMEMKNTLELTQDILEKERKETLELKEQLKTSKSNALLLNKQLTEAKRDMEGTLQSLREKEDEIVRLKAKLYDSLHMNTQDIIRALKGDKDEQQREDKADTWNTCRPSDE